MCYASRPPHPLLANGPTLFRFERTTWREPPSPAPLTAPLFPLFIGFDAHWGAPRCYFQGGLTPLAREVVSVVDQFSNVSEVNILCITQVCKCLHYNTSFSSATYTEQWLPPESRLQPRSADEPWRPPHLLSPAPAGLWRRWQHKSASHWGLGLHFVGHWAVAKAATPCHSDPAPLTPTAPLTLTAVVSANVEMEQALGGNKMHLFSTISARLAPHHHPPPNPC